MNIKSSEDDGSNKFKISEMMKISTQNILAL